VRIIDKALLSILLIFGFAVRSLAQNSFYISTINQGLEKVNIATCDTSFIGYTAATFLDIAVTPDNRLYGISYDKIYEIDTLTGALNLITILNGISSNSLVSDNSGNLLTADNDSLYEIDRFTGGVTTLGFYGAYPPAGDLTFYNDTLYLSASLNRLIKIIIGSTITAQLIGTMQEQNIFGINTICLNGYETMIASGGNVNYSSLYIVNPVNASLTAFCDTLVHMLIYGAASQKDFGNGEICSPTSIDLYTSLDAFSIFPNPILRQFIIKSERKNSRIEIINTLGEKIYSERLKSEAIYLNQPAGIYFVRVSDGEKVFTQKLVIE
jgi:hypothetical protein